MTSPTEQHVGEEVELLPSSSEPEPSVPAILDTSITESQALNLYTSHLLSTWNARTYEFAAVRPLPRPNKAQLDM